MTDFSQIDPVKICLSCGQPKRPQLFLTDVERSELERLVELGDWRAWAKKVLEHSEPKKHASRKLIYDVTEGKVTPEEFAKRALELDSIEERFVP